MRDAPFSSPALQSALAARSHCAIEHQHRAGEEHTLVGGVHERAGKHQALFRVCVCLRLKVNKSNANRQ